MFLNLADSKFSGLTKCLSVSLYLYEVRGGAVARPDQVHGRRHLHEDVGPGRVLPLPVVSDEPRQRPVTDGAWPVRGYDAAVDADAVEPVADRMDCRPGGSVLDRLPNGAHEQGQHE